MPFYIVRNDITRMDVDAIVNAANPELRQGRGVCGAIFQAAGAKLLARECDDIGFCRIGDAVITGGYNLPAEYIIHTPGPLWEGGKYNESQLLEASYRNSLKLAVKNELESIAFPLISSGVYKFPVELAFKIASKTIQAFVNEYDIDVYLVLYDNESFTTGKNIYPDIEEYISERYIPDTRLQIRNLYEESQNWVAGSKSKKCEAEAVLEDLIRDRLVESFRTMLFRKIDELNLKDSEVYRKANIDRRLFSKIRSNPNYSPSKDTALALGIGLELNYVEMQELIGKAGFSLSQSLLKDVIIEYCLERKILNIHDVNELLYEYGESCLGLQ